MGHPDEQHPRHRLTAEEAARRLGVKVETVYAYVSRGLLVSVRAPDGRTSLFAPDEVDAVARRAGRGRGASPALEEVRTGISLIRDDGLYYRGVPVTRLVREYGFEPVAAWLWTGSLDAEQEFAADPAALAVAGAAVGALPAAARTIDRLRVAVAAAAAADPLRYGTEPEAVTLTAGSMVAVMVEALPLLGTEPALAPGGPATGIAERLWPRLTVRPSSPATLAALDAALVLTADHGLAASTTAARIAASVRADPYAVVQAGLGAVDGPHHGLASALAYRLLAEAHASGDPAAVLSERLRSRVPVPGFGHEAGMYRQGDVRARELLLVLGEIPEAAPVLDTVDRLTAVMARRPALGPNIDLALAAFALVCAMPADAGEGIFAIGRTAGWIAHALEEYEAKPHRFRPAGVYTGPQPD
ncbi:citrate synthase [Yinghuangia soli]|uniref:citrate synthase (unknown stereospecificity) n=1 Tax=Yinghuangia soli TaxID=2908204 RepID=A0AA41U214_9ACTN|nr:citrate synthase [Yinghuangia soli]MCF2526649.1 citrate synthase [Yinghuangia soli]